MSGEWTALHSPQNNRMKENKRQVFSLEIDTRVAVKMSGDSLLEGLFHSHLLSSALVTFSISTMQLPSLCRSPTLHAAHYFAGRLLDLPTNKCSSLSMLAAIL